MQIRFAALVLLLVSGWGSVSAWAEDQAGIWDHTDARWGILMSALGAPNPITGGAIYRMNPLLDWRAQAGYLPIPLGSVFASIANVEAGVQLHPFRNAFFMGASVGWQNIFASMNLNFSQTTTATALTLAHIYFTPSLGFLWQRPSGFLIGFDLGVQVPLIAWGGLAVTGADPASLPGYGAGLSSASTAPATHLAQIFLPQITLLRLGYVF